MTEGKQLPCRHLFHEACLSIWLGEHTTCPVCNMKLEFDKETNMTSKNALPTLKEHMQELERVNKLEAVEEEKKEEAKAADSIKSSVQFGFFREAESRDSAKQEKERLQVEVNNRNEIIEETKRNKKD
eukprot:TRINITY_DN3777_c0_g3_i6.p5 TRINITY_DN3777_c0_g3~~TRINITY_DN3777_c0_g3_i6.p5  ORF type:complete len:128 (+),score=39.52 TRINITY_DN3777_c0_g3_i6:1089-1472(+)